MTAAPPVATGLPATGLTTPTVGRLHDDSATMRGSRVARLNHDAVAVRRGSSMTRLDHDPVPMSRRGVTSLHHHTVAVTRLDHDPVPMSRRGVTSLHRGAVARLDHDPVPMSRRGVTSLHRGAVTRLDHDSVPMPGRGVTRLHDDAGPTMATRGATMAATVTPMLAAMLPDRGGPGGSEGRAGVVRFHEPWGKGHEEGG